MNKVKNFSRFYALAKNIPGDREELKENLVRAFTNGRTISLREMNMEEYNRMCNSLQESQSSHTLSQKDFTSAIKKKRSAVLVRMQKLGVNTSDWAAVDEFCLDPRIAGIEFRKISLDELGKLIKKLESISSKPKPLAEAEPFSDPRYIERLVEFTRTQIPS